jgi:hypothetical protein
VGPASADWREAAGNGFGWQCLVVPTQKRQSVFVKPEPLNEGEKTIDLTLEMSKNNKYLSLTKPADLRTDLRAQYVVLSPSI